MSILQVVNLIQPKLLPKLLHFIWPTLYLRLLSHFPPVRRMNVRGEPIEVGYILPLVHGTVQARLRKVLLQCGIRVVVGRELNLFAVLDDPAARHVEVDITLGGRVQAQLLTGEGEVAVRAVIRENGTSHGSS